MWTPQLTVSGRNTDFRCSRDILSSIQVLAQALGVRYRLGSTMIPTAFNGEARLSHALRRWRRTGIYRVQ